MSPSLLNVKASSSSPSPFLFRLSAVTAFLFKMILAMQGVKNEPSAKAQKGTVIELGAVAEQDSNPSSPRNAKDIARPLLEVLGRGTRADLSLHILGAAAAFGAGLANPLMVVLLGRLINVLNDFNVPIQQLSPGDFMQQLNKNALYFVYLFVAKFALVYVHSTSFTLAATRIVRSLRLEHLFALLQKDIAHFDECRPGNIAASIHVNADLVQTGIAHKLGFAFQSISTFITAFVVALTVQWKLTLVSTASVLAGVFVICLSVAFDRKIGAQLLEKHLQASGIAEEALSNVRTLIAFGAAGQVSAKYHDLLQDAAALGKKRGLITGIQYSTPLFFMFCGYALSFWYGLKMLRRGEIADPGTITTVFFSVLMAMISIARLGPKTGAFSDASVAASQLLAIISSDARKDGRSVPTWLYEVENRGLEIKGIHFRYPSRPNNQVLRNVSFSVPDKQVTAIVGSSGSGKSTIINLIERWYEAEAGEIHLNGYDLREYDPQWLRGNIGLVQQKPILFNASVFENIAHGLVGMKIEHASFDEKMEMVCAACIEANAHQFVMDLPDGYHTAVGDSSSLLSHGQKQRIAIARAIVGDPKLLILDEPSGPLDAVSEHLIQKALDRVSVNRTTIVTASRLATVRKAHNIVVLENGQVMEKGTHLNLLAANGAYARLIHAEGLGLTADSDNVIDTNSPQFLEDHRELLKEQKFDPPSEHNLFDLEQKYSFLRCLLIIGSENTRHWLVSLFGVLVSAGAGAVFPAHALVFSRMLGIFQQPGDQKFSRGDFWALMFFALALAALLCYTLLGYIMNLLGVLVSRFHQHEYFRAMLSQDVRFHDHHPPSVLTSQLSADPSSLEKLISGKLGHIAVVFVNITACGILAVAVGWKLGLLALLAIMPPVFAAGYAQLRLDQKITEDTTKLHEESKKLAVEAIAAIRTVTSLALESKVYKEFADHLTGSANTAFKRTCGTIISLALAESVDLLAMALKFWYGGRLMSTREYSTNQFFTVFMAMVVGGQAGGFFLGYTSKLSPARAAMNNMIRLKHQTGNIKTSEGPILIPSNEEKNTAVEFKGVWFSYPSNPAVQVLRDLNLKICIGQTVGIVGPPRSGKTTIISLLKRFYDTTSGEIRVQGQSISSVDVNAYRRTLSVVSQEESLFQGMQRSLRQYPVLPEYVGRAPRRSHEQSLGSSSAKAPFPAGTIRENLTLGHSSPDPISDSILHAACTVAKIHTFISSLPSGYSTEVGSCALALSAGQRQRLAIARAALRRPRILLIDEPASALDADSEVDVRNALNKLRGGDERLGLTNPGNTNEEGHSDSPNAQVLSPNRGQGATTIVIMARRMASVRNADVIYVLGKDGHVAEAGSPEELLKKKGKYYWMCWSQEHAGAS